MSYQMQLMAALAMYGASAKSDWYHHPKKGQSVFKNKSKTAHKRKAQKNARKIQRRHNG